MYINNAKLITDAATKDTNAKPVDTLKQKHANGTIKPKYLINNNLKEYLIVHKGMLNARNGEMDPEI
ncbi:hypothetical protein ACFODO_16065 [Acinetobacter sichuanensis]|uniref:Uncharacterized protein n=3 Tax=Acinetobacter sichuanensis TaxID=2136183 RepID=A0ABV7BI36_9GAMM